MRRAVLAPIALALGATGAVLWTGWRWVTPNRRRRKPPDGFEAAPVRFRSLDGTKLFGLWLEGRKEYPTVILCHGYFKSLEEPLDIAVTLHNAGYNVFLFDFRACGRSGGRFTTIGYKETWDVEAAVRTVGERFGRGPIGALGISMGAAAAIGAAAFTDEIRAVVADSAFSHLEGVMQHKIPQLAPRWAHPFGWGSILVGELLAGGRLRAVRPVRDVGRIAPRPLLLIYGENDSYVPADQPQELFEAAGEPKEMWIAPGSDHAVARIDYPEEYKRRVLDFFDKHLRGVKGGARRQAQKATG